MGAVRLYHPDIVKRLVPNNFLGVDLSIEVKRHEETRSSAQNRWLWGVAYPSIIYWMQNVNGIKLTKHEVHAHNMTIIQGFTYETKEVMGEEVLVLSVPSSANWTKKQFNEAKDKLQDYYAEKGLYIKDPDSSKDVFDTDSFEIEKTVLHDLSEMPYGIKKGTAMIDVPDDYLINRYQKGMYVSPAVLQYMRQRNLI